MVQNGDQLISKLVISNLFKVHIFWKGHKILRNLHLTFDCIYCSQKLGEDFAKFCGLHKIYELYFGINRTHFWDFVTRAQNRSEYYWFLLKSPTYLSFFHIYDLDVSYTFNFHKKYRIICNIFTLTEWCFDS